MRQVDTALTTKGQVTIPVEVRRALGLQPHDKVRFEFDPERGVATLRRAPSSVRELYGAVRSSHQPIEIENLRDRFEQAVADEVMSETD